MKFDKNLAAVHSYLCGDGYVTRNSANQKHKYYHIGFRNTNSVLLRDFQNKFRKYFGILPRLVKKERCIIQNKLIYTRLVNDFKSFYSKDWVLPSLPKRLLKFWIRAFFDCEAWVELQKGKNRAIRADSINQAGLTDVSLALKSLGIISTIRGGKGMYRLSICGRDDLIKFRNKIGFLHPRKKIKLIEVLDSYKEYTWNIPNHKKLILRFLSNRGRLRKDRCEIRLFSIKRKNLERLKYKLNSFNINSKVFGPWHSKHSKYYVLIIKTNGGLM